MWWLSTSWWCYLRPAWLCYQVALGWTEEQLTGLNIPSVAQNSKVYLQALAMNQLPEFALCPLELRTILMKTVPMIRSYLTFSC